MMRYWIVVAGALLSMTAFAQQSQQFVPIVLDAVKFNELYTELRKIPMSADGHERIVALLQALEKQAQADAAREKQ